MRYLKDYIIFENLDLEVTRIGIGNTIIECLIYIFDKYNIPENKDGNTFSWWSDFPKLGIITICSIPDRSTTEDLLDDIMREKKTIERRIKRKIKVKRGYDDAMYRDGWIEIELEG